MSRHRGSSDPKTNCSAPQGSTTRAPATRDCTRCSTASRRSTRECSRCSTTKRWAAARSGARRRTSWRRRWSESCCRRVVLATIIYGPWHRAYASRATWRTPLTRTTRTGTSRRTGSRSTADRFSRSTRTCGTRRMRWERPYLRSPATPPGCRCSATSTAPTCRAARRSDRSRRRGQGCSPSTSVHRSWPCTAHVN